ncbi:MAG: hypothetical protein HQK74_11145, partial [Desulfamplus sp.]|nr:hypothetical protein [Desulfamplus sp.]
MSELELKTEADSLFDAGNTRGAIKLYQMALKLISSKLAQNCLPNSSEIYNEIKSKLFRAYITRAKELKAKNMLSEAMSMQSQAIASVSDPLYLDDESLAIFIKLAKPEEAFKAYNNFCIKKGALPSLEKILAEIAIKNNCNSALVTLLDDNIALKKDMPLIKPALEFMDSGDWEAALDSMKSISRSSPFAHIRIFCKAMAAFYRDDEAEMLKAISMIPPESMLTKITDALKHNPNQSSIDNNKEQKTISNLGMQKLLWSGPFEIYKNLDNIITLSKKENYNDYLQKNILEFAKILMPTHVDSAVQFILETLYQIRCKDEHSFFKMASKLLKNKNS